MKAVLTTALASLFLVACSPGGDEAPSSYAAATPVSSATQEASTVSDAEARAAAAEARVAELEAQAQTNASQPAAAPPATSSATPSAATSYKTPPHSGSYSGNIGLVGEVRLCHTYARTSVERFKGMEVCYKVQLDQHRDGSLYGTGVKWSEQLASSASSRTLPGSERSPITVSGHIDNSDVVHLAYTVQGARRNTRGVAQYGDARYMAGGDGTSDLMAIEGTFRTDAANASGSARLDFEVE